MSIESLRQRLASIPKSVREAVQPALAKSGNELASAMKALAAPSRDTGALIDSIHVTLGGQTTPPYSQPGGATLVPENAIAVTVGDKEGRYSHLVEYGTAQAAAQPFFWPAYRLLKNRIKRRITTSINKSVREGWTA
ncbi:HK97-gp10 family putative phage morphogenesis protein [Methylocapsa aurea]|uniref:HK97-gp10 family putative phage morphogenesis protein n=1 Tax=Methylocapsa aurea TaxID=663610 RepID=UPI000567F359|nr:HK97-gp10 family putative phage morphogenesis protein [Methylocapsa aurea]